jgi:hypothetical protein
MVRRVLESLITTLANLGLPRQAPLEEVTERGETLAQTGKAFTGGKEFNDRAFNRR